MLYFLLGVVVGVLFKNQICKFFNEVKYRFLACFLATLQTGYNRRLGYRKKHLLTEGLKRMQEDNGRRSLNVVEIGAGCGANFAFMPDGVKITCLEPNTKCGGYLRNNARKYSGVEVTEILEGRAEDMSDIPSESVDAVIGTLVLCSVTNVDKCMQEILRILKPGGKYFFMEHVSVDSDKCTRSLSKTRRMQKWLHWIWLHVFGCDMARKTHIYIEKAGFADVQLEHFDAVELVHPTSILPFASVVRPHLIGVATK